MTLDKHLLKDELQTEGQEQATAFEQLLEAVRQPDDALRAQPDQVTALVEELTPGSIELLLIQVSMALAEAQRLKELSSFLMQEKVPADVASHLAWIDTLLEIILAKSRKLRQASAQEDAQPTADGSDFTDRASTLVLREVQSAVTEERKQHIESIIAKMSPKECTELLNRLNECHIPRTQLQIHNAEDQQLSALLAGYLSARDLAMDRLQFLAQEGVEAVQENVELKAIETRLRRLVAYILEWPVPRDIRPRSALELMEHFTSQEPTFHLDELDLMLGVSLNEVQRWKDEAELVVTDASPPFITLARLRSFFQTKTGKAALARAIGIDEDWEPTS